MIVNIIFTVVFFFLGVDGISPPPFSKHIIALHKKKEQQFKEIPPHGYQYMLDLIK
jgi:hypothetical protein